MTPSLRADAILTHHRALLEVIERLKRFQAIDLDAYVAGEDLQWLIERGLERAAACVFDIGAHLLVIAGSPAADDDAGIIDGLGAAGILPQRFVTSFRSMAGFRNVLVHEYLDIDPVVVIQPLHNHLADFEVFADQAMRALRDRGLLTS